MHVARACAVAVGFALSLAAGRAGAGWEVHERALADGDGLAVAAEVFAASGEARVSVGCRPDGMRFVALDYVGYRTGADALRVLYRVDSRNAIGALWPTAEHSVLRIYNSDPVYVAEFARRTMAGWRLSLDVELLPELEFSLRGSHRAISAALARCREINDAPPEEEGEDGEEDGNAAAGAAAPPADSTAAPPADGGDVAATEPLSLPY